MAMPPAPGRAQQLAEAARFSTEQGTGQHIPSLHLRAKRDSVIVLIEKCAPLRPARRHGHAPCGAVWGSFRDCVSRPECAVWEPLT